MMAGNDPLDARSRGGRRLGFAAAAMAAAFLFAAVAANAEAGQGAGPQDLRWESNVSVGVVKERTTTVGIVKAVWWYAVPRTVAIGLSFDYVGKTLPLSVNVSLNAPLPVIVPFVQAGAGAGISTGGILHYGGGIKIRMRGKLGLIGEYRKYSYKRDTPVVDPESSNHRPDYFGGGISYAF